MQCPFAILGLEKSATLEEIDRKWRQMMLKVHPDKTQTETDDEAKRLNDAHEKAKDMYGQFECIWARKKKAEENATRRRRVLDIVRQIFENEVDKTYSSYWKKDYFASKMQALPLDERQEAEAIVQNGLRSCSTTDVEDAEQRIDSIKKEAQHAKEELQKQIHDLATQLRRAKEDRSEMEKRMAKESVRANTAEQGLEAVTGKAHELQTKLDRAEEKIQALESANENVQRTKDELERQTHDLAVQLRSAKEACLEVERRLASESVRASTAEQELAKEMEKAQINAQAFNQAQEKIQELEQINKARDDHARRLKRKITGCSNQSQIEQEVLSKNTPNQDEEKPSKKHKREGYLTKEELQSLKQLVDEFVTNHIRPSKAGDFISTQEIMNAFINSSGFDDPRMHNSFSKELRYNINNRFPEALLSRTGNYRGYHGIKLKKLH